LSRGGVDRRTNGLNEKRGKNGERQGGDKENTKESARERGKGGEEKNNSGCETVEYTLNRATHLGKPMREEWAEENDRKGDRRRPTRISEKIHNAKGN